jgi:nucleoside-diphosphate-sugar epimerase
MRALVTGASGFIGSHLAEKLLRQGYEVACLKRKTSDPKWLEGLNIEFIHGDCCDRDSLSNCIQGYDYILHLSGLTKAHSKKDFYMVNERGTENLIETVSRNNPQIKRFIYLSSLSAFGPKINKGTSGENSKPHPVSDYGKSKLMGEDAVLRYKDRVPISILRPTVVYGPRDRQLFFLFKLIKRGILPSWGDGYISLIYIDDLIDAILLTMQKEDAIGKTYFISDGKIYSHNEVLNEIASALNVRVFKIRVPKSVLPLIGFLGDGIGKITGKSTIINRDKMKELMYTHWICDISKARDELGFEPKIGIKEGIKWTADWYKIHRWL